jgi:hypothetical protein
VDVGEGVLKEFHDFGLGFDGIRAALAAEFDWWLFLKDGGCDEVVDRALRSTERKLSRELSQAAICRSR